MSAGTGCGRAARWRGLMLQLSLTPVLLLGAAQAQAPVNVRIALVVGNAAYAAAPLLNSANDARAMGEALRRLGFHVIEVRDASRSQMAAAIEATKSALMGKQGVGMLYYAGHGLQLDWRNYMVPVDAKLTKAQDVAEQTVDVNTVIAAFKAAGNRMNILVLDACRDNPFSGTASAKGLAPLDAPPGTLLAYATAPGNVAQDGSEASGNGLYTRHLVEELGKPDSKIEDVFKRVRINVRQQSKGRQIPWESTSLEDDFYFDRLPSAVVTKPLEPGNLENLARQQAEFEQEKADWNRIRESTSADDFFGYLKAYPTGYMSEQAQFRLDQLQEAQVVVQPKQGRVEALKSGARRYEVGDVEVYERDDRVQFKKTTFVLKVTAADDKVVVFNGGNLVKDQMGSVLRNRFGEKDPGILVAPADIEVGKKWRSAFTNTQPNGSVSHNFWDENVVRVETIDVPAGRFEAFRVERSGVAVGPNGTATLRGTHWIDPKTMSIVKSEFVRFARGRRVFDQTDVLVSLTRARR